MLRFVDFEGAFDAGSATLFRGRLSGPRLKIQLDTYSSVMTVYKTSPESSSADGCMRRAGANHRQKPGQS